VGSSRCGSPWRSVHVLGFRLGLAAAIAALVGAVLVLLRERLSGLVNPEVFVGLLGISAVLTGVLRVLGGFAAEERLGRRWTLGGIVLGMLELGLGALLLLTSEVDPDLLVPVVAAWGAVSGILLLAQGLRLRRFARTWRGSDDTPPASGHDREEGQPRMSRVPLNFGGGPR